MLPFFPEEILPIQRVEIQSSQEPELPPARLQSHRFLTFSEQTPGIGVSQAELGHKVNTLLRKPMTVSLKGSLRQICAAEP